VKIFRIVLAILFALNLSSAKEQAMINFNELPHAAKLSGALSNKQLALVSVAAYAAAGDADKLKVAPQNARDALKSL